MCVCKSLVEDIAQKNLINDDKINGMKKKIELIVINV